MVEKTRLSFQQFTYIQRGNICGFFCISDPTESFAEIERILINPRKYAHFRYVIVKLIVVIGGWGISCGIAHGWMSLFLTDDKSKWDRVQCQCSPRSMSPYDVTRPQRVHLRAHGESYDCASATIITNMGKWILWIHQEPITKPKQKKVQRKLCIFYGIQHTNGLMDDCSSSSSLAMDLPQSCAKPSTLWCVSRVVRVCSGPAIWQLIKFAQFTANIQLSQLL